MDTVYSYTIVCLTIVRRGGRISFIGCASGIEDRLCDDVCYLEAFVGVAAISCSRGLR